MCCILPYEHPLAGGRSVIPMQLMGEDLIVPGEGKDPDVIALLERFHIKANIKYTTVETDTAYAMMEKGLGVVVANELTLENRQPRGIKLPFEPVQYIEEGIYISDLDGVSPAARAFIEYLRRHVAETDPEGAL
jgi:DNA-binding transcriptional LysR family regulator